MFRCLASHTHMHPLLHMFVLQLHALRRLYGSNVCGEGGEYESLTLDCPLFTRGRIVLDSWQAVTVSEDSMAPVALLHPTAFHVEPKQPPAETGSPAAEAHAAAGAAGAEVIEVPPDWWPPAAQQAGEAVGGAAAGAAEAALDVQLSTVHGRQYCSLTASVAAAPAGASLDLTSAAGTAAALSAALRRISDALPSLGLDWPSSLFVHLYVPSMAQFGAANAAYAAFLPAINPPSRATVELGANAELALVVEVLFARWARLGFVGGVRGWQSWSPRLCSLGGGAIRLWAVSSWLQAGQTNPCNRTPVCIPRRRQPEGRRVLHVQSISEWAPSCIGPYSQATRHRGLALFAGQVSAGMKIWRPAMAAMSA